jgi:hypothetical protein
MKDICNVTENNNAIRLEKSRPSNTRDQRLPTVDSGINRIYSMQMFGGIPIPDGKFLETEWN